jgi:secondary thiamine-phosphate synthase enzyme
MLHTFSVSTRSRNEFVDITERVNELVASSGVREGICMVFVPHTTAAVTVNEHADPDVARDILQKLEKAVPQRDDYAHNEGNSDSHIKASLIGNSQLLPVSGGKLALGTWQGVFFCEFDGPRKRHVNVQLLKS